jgi:hypothetical protein
MKNYIEMDDNVATGGRFVYQNIKVGDDFGANGGADHQRTKSDGERAGHGDARKASQPRLIKTSAEFSTFVPPDYLLDGLMVRGFLYSCTALTGGGKTAFAVLLAAYVALGRNIGDIEVMTRCRALYFAGENPTDVKMRWLAQCGALALDPKEIDVRFVDRAVKFSEATARIKAEIGADEYGLIIVDTSAAFLEGDDENNNKQLLDHAKRLRDLTKLPGSPAVFVCTHPVKNAAADNLLPRGGGAFLNEVDGNFTLKNDDGRLTLHWQGKIRGCDFEPKHLQLMPATDRRLVDSRGRLMQTILAAPVSSEEARRGDDAASADENTLMITMKTKPRGRWATTPRSLPGISRAGPRTRNGFPAPLNGWPRTSSSSNSGASGGSRREARKRWRSGQTNGATNLPRQGAFK